MRVQLPNTIAGTELARVLQNVSVGYDGQNTNLYDISEEVRTGQVVLTASRRGTQPQTVTPANGESVNVLVMAAEYLASQPKALANAVRRTGVNASVEQARTALQQAVRVVRGR